MMFKKGVKLNKIKTKEDKKETENDKLERAYLKRRHVRFL